MNDRTIRDTQEIVVAVQKLGSQLDNIKRQLESQKDYYLASISTVEPKTPEYYLLLGAYLSTVSITNSPVKPLIPDRLASITKEHFNL